MGVSPSCLNGLAERWRLLELRALIQEAHLKIGEHKLSIANDNDFDSPAWAQFRAWAQYLERLRDEEWALRLRLDALKQQPQPAVLPPFPHATLEPDVQEAPACSGSSSRKAPLAREPEECHQASPRSHSRHTSTSPVSHCSLNSSPGASSIGSEEFVDSLMQPDAWASGSQDDKEPLLPGVPPLGSEVMGRGNVQDLLLAGPFKSGVRNRFHREQQQQQQQ
ncbi:hypothetical protein D9Q98_010575 [Chlorella vulgaris]|uniref:Uncharacterized protein n=1 Tax=Chlorella vulgaris TaxID=3077 RepID=A0A9D4TEG7_CHLVU|nr:hypothetical protein D9Q98_010676 [Chlorella vulgaris]KAI3431822.1 hypothetical protein D9Q98_010575 [Chlorella vulgaris]